MAKQKTKRQEKADVLAQAVEQGCDGCFGQTDKLMHHHMQPTGTDQPLVYVLGEAPGEAEDRQGKQFVGKSGRLLRSCMKAVFGQDFIDNYVRFNNCVRCRPTDSDGNNRTPTDVEWTRCRASVAADIATTKPQVILGTGGIPLAWAGVDDEIGLWRGRYFPLDFDGHHCFFFAINHPASILRQQGPYRAERARIFEWDMRRCYQLVRRVIDDKQTPRVWNLQDVLHSIQTEYAVPTLADFPYKDRAAFSVDIETNGKYVYDNPQIRTVSFSDGGSSYSYVVATQQDYDNLKEILYHTPGQKIIHNLVFEAIWFSHFFGDDLLFTGKWEDTMTQAYLLDERKMAAHRTQYQDSGRGLLGLDDLSFLYLGTRVKSLSPINYRKLEENDVKMLMTGGGLDAWVTYRAFVEQVQRLKWMRYPYHIYQAHLHDAVSCALMTRLGVPLDKTAVQGMGEDYRNRALTFIDNFRLLSSVKQVEALLEEEFNPQARKHLLSLFFDVLHCEPAGITGTGGNTTNKAALKVWSDAGVVEATMLLQYREVSTLTSKYSATDLKGKERKTGLQKRVHADGRLHPEFHHLFTVTGRLSSRNPNGQNFDKRKNKQVRAVITAETPENWLLAADYGQIEARLIGSESGDETLIKMINEDYDVHRDFAQLLIDIHPEVIGLLSGDDVPEDKLQAFRSVVKNAYVFPKFYGAGDAKCSAMLGIPEEKIRTITESYLWSRFGGVKEWHSRLLAEYRRKGYIASSIGRRYHYPLGYTEIMNWTIQGLAAYIMKSAMYRMFTTARELRAPFFRPNLSVHDELVFCDVPPDALDDAVLIIATEMIKPVEPYTHLRVPLSVEVKVGKNWADMKKYGNF